MNPLPLIKRVLGTIWRALDGIRKVLHLLILLPLALILVAGLAPDVPTVPTDAALILAPEGALVEQLSGDPLDFDVEVTLKADEVPDLPLGDEGMLGRLSWTSWLKSKPGEEKSVVFRPPPAEN